MEKTIPKFMSLSDFIYICKKCMVIESWIEFLLFMKMGVQSFDRQFVLSVFEQQMQNFLSKEQI